MAAVAAQAIPAAGLIPALSAASGGGDTVETGDTCVLWVVTGATPCTVTITTPGLSAFGDAIADPVSATIVANSGAAATGAPFGIKLPTARFGDPTTTYATLAWSATTNVKFWVSK